MPESGPRNYDVSRPVDWNSLRANKARGELPCLSTGIEDTAFRSEVVENIDFILNLRNSGMQ